MEGGKGERGREGEREGGRHRGRGREGSEQGCGRDSLPFQVCFPRVSSELLPNGSHYNRVEKRR